ncbi:hypothetical protein Ccrd_009922 [Cynara cardunculus var. scolymus]|uniref:Uncharacterized protein n=1 Tax=Cynara cardunculus var. scolymus TaxID=59895 RepID=A0A118K735_CYNCS|nr:hypothetical protein Ccrd_009922 [Cynara cardunculus var. scolymus]
MENLPNRSPPPPSLVISSSPCRRSSPLPLSLVITSSPIVGQLAHRLPLLVLSSSIVDHFLLNHWSSPPPCRRSSPLPLSPIIASSSIVVIKQGRGWRWDRAAWLPGLTRINPVAVAADGARPTYLMLSMLPLPTSFMEVARRGAIFWISGKGNLIVHHNVDSAAGCDLQLPSDWGLQPKINEFSFHLSLGDHKKFLSDT